VHELGALFIADEVQPGFGRTGETFWGFARHDVVPDIVTLGKPMGNGYPVSGIVANHELFELLSAEAGYFNTFGGSQAAVAAATAVLDVIEDEGLQENARVVGDYLRHRLEELATRYQCLGDIRGAGLFIGVDIVTADGLPDAAGATRLINEMRRQGVLLGAAGRSGNILKIRPPLCFTRANADWFVARMESVLVSL
jgi:4-aminobutyrate aminotransferase-like enzyme